MFFGNVQRNEKVHETFLPRQDYFMFSGKLQVMILRLVHFFPKSLLSPAVTYKFFHRTPRVRENSLSLYYKKRRGMGKSKGTKLKRINKTEP